MTKVIKVERLITRLASDKRLYDFFITRFYDNMFLKAFITFAVSWTIFWLGFCVYHFISNW